MSSYGLIYVLTANFIKVVHVVNIHLFSSLMSLTKIGRQEMPWKWNIYVFGVGFLSRWLVTYIVQM